MSHPYGDNVLTFGRLERGEKRALDVLANGASVKYRALPDDIFIGQEAPDFPVGVTIRLDGNIWLVEAEGDVLSRHDEPLDAINFAEKLHVRWDNVLPFTPRGP